jgi:hypothetical protein
MTETDVGSLEPAEHPSSFGQMEYQRRAWTHSESDRWKISSSCSAT